MNPRLAPRNDVCAVGGFWLGVIMLIYLDNAIREREQRGQLQTVADLREALIEGTALRVRPKAMTVAVIVAGLLPLFIGIGTGNEVMQYIAAPMVGGRSPRRYCP